MPRRRKSSSDFEKLFKEPVFVAAFFWTLGVIFLPWVWKIVLLSVLGVCFVVGIVYFLHVLERRRQSGIENIDAMNGKQFEDRLWLLFRDQGYSVETTPLSGDYGADLILGKNGVRTVVQAKRYSHRVSLEAIQEAVAAQAKYHCSQAIVVTNSYFTKAAKELAYHNRTELWDRDRLMQELYWDRKRRA